MSRDVWRASRRPPRWLGGFPVVPGTRLYPLVPPLPVLDEITNGPPPFRGNPRIAELPGGGLKKPETHLVGRPLAPEDVPRRHLLPVDERLALPRVVEAARDGQRVADVRVDGLLQVVGVLPVELPARDVQQRLPVQLDA